MLRSKIKGLAVGLSMALALIHSPAHAATITIKLGAASSFGTTANDLIAAFQAYYANYGLTYSVQLSVDSAANLESGIISGGATGPYDLFLSSSKKEPHDLLKNYPTLVVGTPFKYAKDFLELYSLSVDISKGLPYPLKTDFVIPDPTQDNYGEAAAEVLASAPYFISTIPSGHVYTRPDGGSALASIQYGPYAYGFVPKSQICQLSPDGTEIYPDGSYHHEYKPANLLHPSERLVLKGIKIALTRTADQETELSNFIAFITGGTDSNGNTTTVGTDIIHGYCFKTPE